MSESQAEPIVGDKPYEAPIGRLLPHDVKEAEAKTGDILLDVQNLNLVSDVAGPFSNAGGLVFLDEFRRHCGYHLCLREQSVRRAHEIASHLEWVHSLNVRQANLLVCKMDHTH